MNSYADFRNESDVLAEKWIYDSLLAIGIMPHLKGFSQTVRAVVLTAESVCKVNIKDIYVLIARESDCKQENVERNIRNAICYAQSNETLIGINKIAGVEIVKNKYSSLSNNQLVSLLAHLYLQKLCPPRSISAFLHPPAYL